MKKWFRWYGILAFLILFVLIAVIGHFHLNSIVKTLIETTGTALVRAKVELDSVDVDVWPTHFELKGLQVTNPKHPMENAFQTDVISFDMDTRYALLGKIIVNEFAVEGIQFGTERSHSGALDKRAKKKDGSDGTAEEEGGFKLPTVETPDVKQILKEKEEELLTVQRSRALQKKIEEKKKSWQTLKNDLPDKEKLDSYKTRYEEIRRKVKADEISALEALEQLKQLKKDISAERDRIKKVKDTLQGDIAELKQDLALLKQAPKEDKERILKEIGYTDGGLEGVARTLFGPKISAWYDQAKYWYGVLKPYLESDEDEVAEKQQERERQVGENIAFKEFHPMPEFWLKSIVISGPGVKGSGKNFTDNQRFTGTPATAQLQFEAPESGRYVLDVTSDHRKENQESFQLNGEGISVRDIRLAEGSAPITLASSNLQVSGEGTLKDGNVAAEFVSQFSNANFDTGEENSGNKLTQILNRGLKKADAFDVSLKLSGEVLKPNISIRSNLAGHIKSELNAVVAEKKSELEADLKVKLDERLAEVLAPIQDELKELTGSDEQVNLSLSSIDELENLSDRYKDELEDKAKSKIKDKLDDKLNKLFGR
jgi:uncharacterized protein (TIGR03545 family)